MSTTTDRGVRIASAVAVGLLAIPVFGALIWGAWRLVFWAVIGSSPTLRHAHPNGIAVPGPMPMGQGMVSAGGLSLGTLGAVVAFVGLLVLVGLVALLVLQGVDGDDAVEALRAAYARGELDDETFARRRRVLSGESDAVSDKTW